MNRRQRRRAKRKNFCHVCEVVPVTDPTLIQRCSAAHPDLHHTVCDSCFIQHISSVLSRDITSPVICPEKDCPAELTANVIDKALSSSDPSSLREQYLSRSRWRGTSEQWIKQFSKNCPRCGVPIEKNGGCDRMCCSRCSLVFRWSQAEIWSRSIPLPGNTLYRIRISTLIGIVLALVFVFFLLKLWFTKESLATL